MQIIFYAGALVFKQDATLKEFWEHELEPFYHFIPVNADLTDLVEKVCVCMGSLNMNKPGKHIYIERTRLCPGSLLLER